MVDLETADQRIVTAEICGPVWIQIDGFRLVARRTLDLKSAASA